MVDLTNFKEGDKLGTLYCVYADVNGYPKSDKYEDCTIKKLQIDNDFPIFDIRNGKGISVSYSFGALPHYGTKLKNMFLNKEEALIAYRDILMTKRAELNKEVAKLEYELLFTYQKIFD